MKITTRKITIWRWKPPIMKKTLHVLEPLVVYFNGSDKAVICLIKLILQVSKEKKSDKNVTVQNKYLIYQAIFKFAFIKVRDNDSISVLLKHARDWHFGQFFHFAAIFS